MEKSLMVDIKDINPVAPIWPSKPPDRVGQKKEQADRSRHKEKRHSDNDDDDDSENHQIDEFA